MNPATFVYKEGGRNMGTGRGNVVAPTPTDADAHPGKTEVATPAAPFLPPLTGPSDGQRGGVLIAWDPVTQTERWRKEGGGASGGGTLSTASNLLFQVLPDGRLIVYSADKGEKLHEINTGLRLGMGPPVTYMVDGKQYVSVLGGRGVVVAPPAVPGAAAGAAPAAGRGAATADVGAPVPPRILTFALDGAAR